MAPVSTTSSASIPALFRLLSKMGVSTAEVEAATGIHYRILEDPDVRITVDQFLKLWTFAIEKTKNPALALTLRDLSDPEPMHLVLHICSTSSTLREAMELNIRYSSLICDIDKYDWKEGAKISRYRYINTSPKYQSPWFAEYSLASTVRLLQAMIGDDEVPVAVHFQHSPPDYVDVYQSVFRCPVLFNQLENAIVFRNQIFERSIPSNNPYLLSILKKHADSLLRQQRNSENTVTQVQEMILTYLPYGEVKADFIAQQLNLHRRTLARRLKEEGTSFQEVLEKTRKQLALSYLEQKMAFSEITSLLGFSEPSAFQHAFKRWFGHSPGEYRQQISCKVG